MAIRTPRTGPAGLSIIKHFEQLHDGDLKKAGLQPKACPTGWWTVGYGRVVVDPVTGKRLSTLYPEHRLRALELYPALTIAQAEAMLQEDLRSRENTVDTRVKVPLQQHEFDALVSLEYNTGAIGANSSVVRLLNANRRKQAADAILAWNKGRVNGLLQELRGLTRRRQSERHLFLTGKVDLFNTTRPAT